MKRYFVRRCGWWFLASVLLTACMPSWADAPAERAARLAAHYSLDKPEGDGPFPAVMLVPGCQGFAPPLWKGRYERATRRLKEVGFAVIRVDSLAAAEVSSCSGIISDPETAAGDIVTATKYLRAQSFVKPDAINVLSWSFGGHLAFHALTKTKSRKPAQVAAVVAYAPYISLMQPPWSVDVPVLVLCSADDTVAPCEKFEALLTEVPTRNRVKIVKYPEGYHAFDNSDLPAKAVSPSTGKPIGYNEKIATAAWAEVEKFLRR